MFIKYDYMITLNLFRTSNPLVTIKELDKKVRANIYLDK